MDRDIFLYGVGSPKGLFGGPIMRDCGIFGASKLSSVFLETLRVLLQRNSMWYCEQTPRREKQTSP